MASRAQSLSTLQFSRADSTAVGPRRRAPSAGRSVLRLGRSGSVVGLRASSSRATLAIDAILSPSFRFMTRTPWVLRPTMRISSDVRAVDHALGGDEHDVVAVADRRDADHRAVAFAACGCRAGPCRRGAACGSASPTRSSAARLLALGRGSSARLLGSRPPPPRPRRPPRRRCWRRTASACRSRSRTPSAGSPPGRRRPCRPPRRRRPG